ncbi:MAG: hypothetical protein JJ992_18925, partial [Planctomycetes bacterium]|nr:hypothetical protein [Planctomycetota bacterium]
LRLAAEGDVKRFLDEVQKAREKFRAVRHDQNNFGQVWQDIQPLQAKFNSEFFDDSSLFRKVLANTLDSDQWKLYEQRESERRRFRYEANIALAVATLEDGVPLRDQQRQQLVALLLAETEPPEKYGQYDYYVVLYKAAKLPEEKLKPIFDEAQWRALTLTFTQAKGMQAFLRRGGFIPP